VVAVCVSSAAGWFNKFYRPGAGRRLGIILHSRKLDTFALTALPQNQNAIREFLKIRTSYDVLPVSFRLIVLDTGLLVKKSLLILVQNGRTSPVLSSTQRGLQLKRHLRHRLSAFVELQDLRVCRPFNFH
jgi:hypothetical protein